MKIVAIDLPIKEIGSFCQKWKVKELSFFGSVLREDFNPKKSDIDVLVEFLPDAHWGWDVVIIKNELEELLNQSVDLVSKKAIEKSRNPYRKEEILNSYEVIYEQTA